MAEVTIESVRLLSSILGISVPLEIASTYRFEGVSTARLINICRHFGADTYYAGAGGRDYMNMPLFERERIAVEFQQFTCPVYPQHWSKSADDFMPGLSVIEDCAQCVGATIDGKPVGSLSTLSVFSMYATKVLSAGEGGMVVTSDSAIAPAATRSKKISTHSWMFWYERACSS